MLTTNVKISNVLPIIIITFLLTYTLYIYIPTSYQFAQPLNTSSKIYLANTPKPQSQSPNIILGEYTTLQSPRVLALRIYLSRHGSPMAKYANVLVEEADKNGQDWRIITAIAGVESAFGTITPYQSYNAWGWRGGPGGDFSKFKDWPSAIAYVTRQFTKGYGINPDPYTIESTYCPPCGRNPQHAWAQGVTRFKNEITQVYQQLIKTNPALREVK